MTCLWIQSRQDKSSGSVGGRHSQNLCPWFPALASTGPAWRCELRAQPCPVPTWGCRLRDWCYLYIYWIFILFVGILFIIFVFLGHSDEPSDAHITLGCAQELFLVMFRDPMGCREIDWPAQVGRAKGKCSPCCVITLKLVFQVAGVFLVPAQWYSSYSWLCSGITLGEHRAPVQYWRLAVQVSTFQLPCCSAPLA